MGLVYSSMENSNCSLLYKETDYTLHGDNWRTSCFISKQPRYSCNSNRPATATRMLNVSQVSEVATDGFGYIVSAYWHPMRSPGAFATRNWFERCNLRRSCTNATRLGDQSLYNLSTLALPPQGSSASIRDLSRPSSTKTGNLQLFYFFFSAENVRPKSLYVYFSFSFLCQQKL